MRRRGAADGEAAVVAGAVAEVAVQDVEERRVAGADQPVAVDVRVRRAALAGDRVDALDVLAAEVVEHLADQADALVLPHAGAQEPVQLLVGGVDHRARLGRAGRSRPAVLIRRASRKTCWPSTTSSPASLQRGQHRHLDQVDADRLVGQAVLGEHRRRPCGRPPRRCRRRGGRRRAGWRCRPGPVRCRPARGCRAGGAGRPSRSPRRPARRRAAAAANRISLSIAQVPMWVEVM